MSKAIVIKKNGVSQNLTVDKLRTNGADGQSIDWVPEDTVQLAALNATANGTYTPTGGAYGFEYATVSVPGSVVTGKKPDGNTYVYTKDGSGALVETKVPSEIRITAGPSYTGPYGDGANISFDGLVVHAYDSDGADMGVVPYNELVFPETTADAQKTDEWTDGQGLNAMQIAYVSTWRRDINQSGKETEEQVFCCTKALGADVYGRPCSFGGDIPGTLFITRYNGSNYAASMAGSNVVNQYSHFNGDATPYGYLSYGWRFTGGSSARAGDKVFSGVSFNDTITQLPVSTVNPTTVDPANLHATQSIPVQWSRPGDGAILETTFDITVQQSFGGASGGGGQAGETGAGRND